LFSGLAFFVMLPWMQRTLTISLDFDWFYRVAFPGIINSVLKVIEKVYLAVLNLCVTASATGSLLNRWMSQGNLRMLVIGNTIIFTLVLLMILVFLSNT
ncbi:MAG: hypothetical protein MI673_00965, partial [Thiotrichales bacterium]|nr:hypothetical protein [Thiotrichales bacterium]